MAKKKFELEYVLRTSDHILYTCLSTPSGLSDWFADDVNVKGEVYTFIWEGEQRRAELDHMKRNVSVKFHWIDETKEKTYFEMRIRIDEMTGEVALIVTDYAEEDELDEYKLLWDSAVDNLRRHIGA
ncbi:MAG: hypothetical protein RL220_405 [Bacteroidota bacterium]|jgi:uncharacterized protein YndB with AHSA1/START domain